MTSEIDKEKAVEAVLFAAGRPLTRDEISDATGLGKRAVSKVISSLIERYRELDGAIEVSVAGEKYVMQVRASYTDYASRVAPVEISESVLKTAALIGYYQPLKQSSLVDMRGPKVYDHVKILQESGLILTRKHKSTKMIYTTDRFSEYFGIASTDPEKVRSFLAERLGLKYDKKKRK